LPSPDGVARDDLAGFDPETDVFQDRRLIAITEGHLVEFDLTRART
jgi:hypothetical protein